MSSCNITKLCNICINTMLYIHSSHNTRNFHSIKYMTHRLEIFFGYLPHKLRDVIALLNFARNRLAVRFSRHYYESINFLCVVCLPLNRFAAPCFYVCNNAIRRTRSLFASASCNVEPSLLAASARRVSVDRLARRCARLYVCVRYVQRARVGRDMCGPAIHYVSAPMYYIRNEEWCNKEAALPKIAEVCRARSCSAMSSAQVARMLSALHRSAQHTARTSSAATSERRHMQFCASRAKKLRLRKGWQYSAPDLFHSFGFDLPALFTLYFTFCHPKEESEEEGERASEWPSSCWFYLSAARRKCALLMFYCDLFLCARMLEFLYIA